MPLNWNTKNCNPSIPADDNESAMRDTIIQLTMIVGLGEITPKNIDEFYSRVHILEALRGAFMHTVQAEGLKDRPITREDVARWLGLKTNVRNTTRNQFLKVVSNIMDEYPYQS